MPVTPRRFNWERPAALWSLIGFAMSLVAHALTYAGIDVSRGMPLVWALHIGAMIAFGAMIIVSRRNSSPNGFVLPDWPAWAYMLLVAATLYAAFNFMHFFTLNEGGTPEIVADGYALSDHGRVIRTLTEAEYWRQKAYVLRAFSGHWMIFFLVPALYFALRRDQEEQAGTRDSAA